MGEEPISSSNCRGSHGSLDFSLAHLSQTQLNAMTSTSIQEGKAVVLTCLSRCLDGTGHPWP